MNIETRKRIDTMITLSREAHAALDGLVCLANDPAGRSLTLAEVFGTGHNKPEIEGVRALEALAMLDAHYSAVVKSNN